MNKTNNTPPAPAADLLTGVSGNESPSGRIAPAAEQGEQWLDIPPFLRRNATSEEIAEWNAKHTQPEARGVEGMVHWPKWLHDRCLEALEKVEIQFASAGTCSAAVSETLMAARGLRVATPNPVRAEQPEGKGADRMAIRLLVAAGHVTEAKANEALCIAHGFEPGPLAPAAPVGVDEARHVLADEHAFLVGLKLAMPESKRANIQERIDAVRLACAALAGKDGA